MQLEFELWEPKPAPPREVVCWFCGEESPNEFVGELNHPPIGEVCGKAWLLLNHCRAIVKFFEGDERVKHQNCYADNCETHYRGEWSRKPIPECARLEYDQKRAWLIAAGVPAEQIPVPSRALTEGTP